MGAVGWGTRRSQAPPVGDRASLPLHIRQRTQKHEQYD